MYDEERWQRKRERWEQRMNRHWERRTRYRQNAPSRHLFAGFVFLLLGGLFLLGNMGYLDVDRVLRFWPVLLVALGLFKLVESGDDYAHSSGIFWVVIGGLFLMGNMGILRVAFRDLWPVVLIGIGALMLWRSALARRSPRDLPQEESTTSSSSFSENSASTTTASGDEGAATADSSNS